MKAFEGQPVARLQWLYWVWMGHPQPVFKTETSPHTCVEAEIWAGKNVIQSIKPVFAVSFGDKCQWKKLESDHCHCTCTSLRVQTSGYTNEVIFPRFSSNVKRSQIKYLNKPIKKSLVLSKFILHTCKYKSGFYYIGERKYLTMSIKWEIFDM